MLRTSTFPTMGKVSRICPVLKKGDITQITNYRPISILCNFSKIFETIIFRRLYDHVEDEITAVQHGFIER